jgi:uncharacterized ferredoxin-like protein
MILNERDARHEHVLQVARQMMTAARTAPKGKGIDIIEVALITDEEIKQLSDTMIAMVEEHGMKFFLRDADNILSAECVVLIGTREQTQGLNCGHCGFTTCDGLKVNRSVPFSEERLFACFDELGLEHELYTKRVNEVSGGQRQRIMLAVAAMLNKPLIIIDEPTSALDADSTGRVLSFFRRQAERGTAVLAVSHDKDFASGCHYLIEL